LKIGSCQCPANYQGKVCETYQIPKCVTNFLPCQNNGVFNNNTCKVNGNILSLNYLKIKYKYKYFYKCDCFSNYNGLLCENLKCLADPLDCSSFDKSYCLLPLIKSYCPFLCGTCTAQATTSTSQQSTTTVCSVSQDAYACAFVTSAQCSYNDI
jgi:hypothetical protein